MIADAPTYDVAKQNSGTRKSSGIKDTYGAPDQSSAPILSDRPELFNLSKKSSGISAENFLEESSDQSPEESRQADLSNLPDLPDAPDSDIPDPDVPDIAVKRGISGETDAQDMSAMQNTADEAFYFDDELPTGSSYNPDRGIWIIWALLLVIAVIALPFIAKQGEILSAIADACMTLIGS